jgi:hypothetical protein
MIASDPIAEQLADIYLYILTRRKERLSAQKETPITDNPGGAAVTGAVENGNLSGKEEDDRFG